MVEVTNEGTILVGEAAIDLCRVKDNVIVLALQFDTDEDAKRFFNLMRASINNGCIHVHVNAGEEEDLDTKH